MAIDETAIVNLDHDELHAIHYALDFTASQMDGHDQRLAHTMRAVSDKIDEARLKRMYLGLASFADAVPKFLK